MHIEKNVCDSVVGTLLGIKGKTKDGTKARGDLKRMNIKRHLHLIKKGNYITCPPARYTLNKEQKNLFCKVLGNVRVPDGYASNLSRGVNIPTTNITGWKSHDCHIIMQELLPLAIRKVLPKAVLSPLIDLSAFFKALCSKTADFDHFNKWSKKIALVLCNMEKIFPPAFFDVMMHLPVHLSYEASIAGPVHYRWMYPIERYLHTLKGYVRNKSRPEGCIAEGYLVEECLSFCSMYLEDIESRRNRRGRNADQDVLSISSGFPIFRENGKSLGAGKHVQLDGSDWSRARRCVLFNCPEVKKYIDEHLVFLKRSNPRKTLYELEQIQKDKFAFWFHDRVNNLYVSDPASVTEDMHYLAIGPDKWVHRYKKYIVNGFRFRTKDADTMGPSQNSGVYVKSQTSSYSSVRDKNPTRGDMDYYGVLTDVIVLSYHGGRKVALFECDWADCWSSTRGVKTDEHGFTLVNFEKTLVTDDKLILASQALQVFYVQDPVELDWNVAVKTQPRDFFDM